MILTLCKRSQHHRFNLTPYNPVSFMNCLFMLKQKHFDILSIFKLKRRVKSSDGRATSNMAQEGD